MLNVLDLSGNSLHGKIPSSMSKIKNPGIINLSDNRSSRKIYRYWKGFELLDTLDLSSIEDQSIWWHPKFHVLTTLASSYEIEQQQFLGNFCGLCKTAQHLVSDKCSCSAEDKGILEGGDIKNKGEGISFSLMLSALISSLNLELIIYMFLDQGFELMKNSKIRYLNLLSVNIEVKIFRRRTSELSCWNLNSSWAWGFVEL
ncbi:hypothetical protein NC652_020822 [Populus alba x Populus x berolinensis]|nr:hypothetical protein NC652_020822 [Populus alba x Populus x berolinensis]